MSSRWKGPVCSTFRSQSIAGDGKVLLLGSTVMFKSLMGSSYVVVYDGSRFVDLRLRPHMLGDFAGVYIFSKRFGPSMHSKPEVSSKKAKVRS